jgi:hypothetical protein
MEAEEAQGLRADEVDPIPDSRVNVRVPTTGLFGAKGKRAISVIVRHSAVSFSSCNRMSHP